MEERTGALPAPDPAAVDGAPSPRRVTQHRPDEPVEHRTHPCARCPWRRDADLTTFSGADMAMLRRANGRPGDEAPFTASRVGCHKDQPGTTHAWRLCAGWLAVAGHYHLGVRIAAMAGGLPPDILEPGPGWPELYESLEELEAARRAQLAQTSSGGS